MILGHSEVIRRIKEDRLVEGGAEEFVQGAGMDIRVGKMHTLKSGGKLLAGSRETPNIEEVSGSTYFIKPGEYFLIETIEKVNMPLDLAARMLPRSTLQRSGMYLFHALIDPGYSGKLVFGIKNLGEFVFELEKGARIAQLCFEQVSGESKEYKGRYQGGKVV